MDNTDRQLISLLRKDARMNVAALATRLGVSRGTVTNRLRKLGEPGVQALHDTNGRWDLLAELRADSMIDLSALLERVRLIKGIANTETSILLATYR